MTKYEKCGTTEYTEYTEILRGVNKKNFRVFGVFRGSLVYWI